MGGGAASLAKDWMTNPVSLCAPSGIYFCWWCYLSPLSLLSSSPSFSFFSSQTNRVVFSCKKNTLSWLLHRKMHTIWNIFVKISPSKPYSSVSPFVYLNSVHFGRFWAILYAWTRRQWRRCKEQSLQFYDACSSSWVVTWPRAMCLSIMWPTWTCQPSQLRHWQQLLRWWWGREGLRRGLVEVKHR